MKRYFNEDHTPTHNNAKGPISLDCADYQEYMNAGCPKNVQWDGDTPSIVIPEPVDRWTIPKDIIIDRLIEGKFFDACTTEMDKAVNRKLKEKWYARKGIESDNSLVRGFLSTIEGLNVDEILARVE